MAKGFKVLSTAYASLQSIPFIVVRGGDLELLVAKQGAENLCCLLKYSLSG
jgi:hypothetical protein